MAWEVYEEKLLCHIVLDDGFGRRLSSRAAPAFFRGFIVQNRATGAVYMKIRWKYQQPDERQWIQVAPRSTDVDGAIAELREGMLVVLEQAAEGMGIRLPAGAVQFFEPPDDGGDGDRTLAWLVERDLVEITRPS